MLYSYALCYSRHNFQYPVLAENFLGIAGDPQRNDGNLGMVFIHYQQTLHCHKYNLQDKRLSHLHRRGTLLHLG